TGVTPWQAGRRVVTILGSEPPTLALRRSRPYRQVVSRDHCRPPATPAVPQGGPNAAQSGSMSGKLPGTGFAPPPARRQSLRRRVRAIHDLNDPIRGRVTDAEVPEK